MGSILIEGENLGFKIAITAPNNGYVLSFLFFRKMGKCEVCHKLKKEKPELCVKCLKWCCFDCYWTCENCLNTVCTDCTLTIVDYRQMRYLYCSKKCAKSCDDNKPIK